MVDSKTIVVIVLVLVVAFGGGINYILDKVSGGTGVSGVFQNPTGFVTKYMPEKNTKEVRINANLTFDLNPALALKISEPAKTFSIDYSDDKASISLGSFSVNSPTPVSLEFRDYSGTMSAAIDVLSFAGTAGQVKYNAGYITQDKPISVKGDGFKFKRAEITGIQKTSLHLQNMTGTITVVDGTNNIVASYNNAEITLEPFRGTVAISGNNLVLDGTGIFRTSMLLAPGK